MLVSQIAFCREDIKNTDALIKIFYIVTHVYKTYIVDSNQEEMMLQ